MGWIGDQWADAKLTLSRRQSWEIVIAIVCIILAIASVVMCFIFTIVAPPGDLDSSNNANSLNSRRSVAQQMVHMIHKRSADNLPNPKAVLGRKSSDGEFVNDALICAGIGSDMLENGATPTEAAEATMFCLGITASPEQEIFARLGKDLDAALSTGNSHAVANVLIKAVQNG